MNKFYLITNISKDRELTITNHIRTILEKNGAVCKCDIDILKKSEESIIHNNPNSIDDDTECIIVVGGDGTLIRAAGDLKDKDIPMIGVNMGNLGFLAEIETDAIEEMLKMLINDDYRVESRIMLNGLINHKNGEIENDNIALNDIVLARNGALRIIDFKVYVNNEFLNLYSADGMIITTPTGSTAYNLSAGGPILEPCANIIAITPICSHTLGSRSIVLSADSNIKIEICTDRHLNESNARAYFDGDTSVILEQGDTIEITKSVVRTKILKLNHMSFVEVLHKKMN